jgi:ABC-type thiamin/hydroxymethylpyrimidine transport system permease subunit
MNYGVLGFFIAYIILDIFIKGSLNCIPGFFSNLVIGDMLSGIFLGGVIAGVVMYGSSLKSYLYINEVNNNQEVCSMPSKQQFKCSVYKNGELVGSSIN